MLPQKENRTADKNGKGGPSQHVLYGRSLEKYMQDLYSNCPGWGILFEKQPLFSCESPGHGEASVEVKGSTTVVPNIRQSLFQQFRIYNSSWREDITICYAGKSEKDSIAEISWYSWKTFISKDAVERLSVTPVRLESREIVTVSGTINMYISIFKVTIGSVGVVTERIELAWWRFSDTSSVTRQDMSLQWRNQAENKYVWWT